MSNADLTWETPTWAVGPFDASGRNYTTGNASFWLSLYSRDAIHMNNPHQEDVEKIDTTATEADTWAKVTNALSLELPAAQGWAIYSRTRSGENAAIRLPKNDDIYYYYNRSVDKIWRTVFNSLVKRLFVLKAIPSDDRSLGPKEDSQ